jgi:DNA-binding NarL/FixJ family response regulator
MDFMATRTSKLITVALVEDDDRIRRTVAMILDRAGDCRCVGQYAAGEAAVAAIPALAPQVIIMDINLPGMSGVDCVRQLVELEVKAHVLMLTVHKDSDAIFDALAAGAGGYLVKPVPAEQLLAAVRDIYGGGAPMTSSIARKVVQSFKSAAPEKMSDDLSPRERDILDLLAQGFMYKEIADKLDSSYATVRTHIEHIYTKLHVNSRSQAVAKSLKR